MNHKNDYFTAGNNLEQNSKNLPDLPETVLKFENVCWTKDLYLKIDQKTQTECTFLHIFEAKKCKKKY